jgi:diguanylate cyclase (GGDEF)-like protein
METGLGRLRRGLTPGSTLLGVNLDRFRDVNDQYGYEVGDEVLAEIGRRLVVHGRRHDDIVGRLAADGFALFLAGLADRETAMRRADEVWVSITGPVATTVGPVAVGASIGVCVIRSTGAVPATGTVLRHADEAMQHAKRAGGGTHLFDPVEPPPFDDGSSRSQR